MARVKHIQSKFAWFLGLAVVFILFVSIVISLIELRKSNTIRSNAQTSSANLTDCLVDSSKITISEQEQSLFDKINAYRLQHGLNALVWSDALLRGAKWMSEDMLKSGKLSHIDSLGRDPGTRLTNCGYTDYTTLAENIDSGTNDSTSTFNAWQHSPPHNANLLNQSVVDVGIGLSSNPPVNSYYWTLDLGSRTTSPTPTITNTPSVTPTLSPSPTPPNTLSPTPSPTLTPVPTSILTPTLTLAPTFVPDFTPNPHDMQLLVSAKIRGIGNGGNKSPIHKTRHITVMLFDTTNKLITTGNGYIVYDGSDLFKNVIHLGQIDKGSYYVKIHADHILEVTVKPLFQVLDASRLNALPTITLRQGDLDDDNALTIKDYNQALACFQNIACNDKNLIDFNEDNIANIIDYNILLNNFSEEVGD